MDNKDYYGTEPQPPVFEGMSQYREPLCFELAGERYRLVFEDKQYYVEFKTGDVLSWGELGAPGQIERYDCAKGAASVYFVNFELTGASPRTNVTLVIDTAERLVTMVKTITGFDTRYPFLCDGEYFFGAIALPGARLPEKRHGFTRDLVGKRIHWHYAPTTEIIHIYYSEDHCRVKMPAGTKWGDMPAEEFNAMLEREPYDEKAAYIKIKENLYLVSVLEQNMAKTGFTGNSLLFLIDTHRVHDVGRSFGHAGLREGNLHPENYIFGAFGDFVKPD
ncbi:MAG: molybdenum cofactor biosynthesis F family protein [Oscillospiraceae bacterium]|jgi:hypothetical protein|nr:molybdenum cofactor biosynthesis F family protein [Oscillospiraceae bacterium]